MKTLKDKSVAVMINDKMQDLAAMSGIAYYFAPSAREMTNSNKQFERIDVISLKRKRGCSIAFLLLNRC